jgi:AraC-like DNA-binding protein
VKDIFPSYSIGHFLNSPGSATEFEIMRFEDMQEPDVEDPHKHTFYEIIWIEEGKSRQTIDYNTYCLQPQTLFFISPGQVHLFEEWEHLKGGTIFFTEDFFLLHQQNKDKLFELSFLDNFYSSPSVTLPSADFSEIKHTIDLLMKERQRNEYKDCIIQSYLHILLLQVQRSINNQQAPVSSKYIILYKKLKHLVDLHFRENYSVSRYADMLYVTQHHLNLVTKQVTGKTAGEVIRARALLEAKRLLTFTDKTVSEIATELGFLDSSYFARLFRNETGVSPGSFKTDMSEKYRTK